MALGQCTRAPRPSPARARPILTHDFSSKEDSQSPAFRASAESAARCPRGPCAGRLAELGTGTAEGPAPPSPQQPPHAQQLGQTAHGREPVGFPPKSPPQGRRILRADSGVQLKTARGPALQKTQEAGRLTHPLRGSQQPHGGASLAVRGLGRCVCTAGAGVPYPSGNLDPTNHTAWLKYISSMLFKLTLPLTHPLPKPGQNRTVCVTDSENPDTRVQREARPQRQRLLQGQRQTSQLPSPDPLCGLRTCPSRTAVPRPSSRTSSFIGCM